MGIQRGATERVLDAKTAPQAVRINASVPDIGAPLAAGAQAFGAWAKVFGKLSDIGTDYTRRHNINEANLDSANGEYADARAKYDKAKKERDIAVSNATAEAKKNGIDPDPKSWETNDLQLESAKRAMEGAARKQAEAQDRMNRTGFFGYIGTPQAATGATYIGEDGNPTQDSAGISTFGRMFNGTLRASEKGAKAYSDPLGALGQ